MASIKCQCRREVLNILSRALDRTAFLAARALLTTEQIRYSQAFFLPLMEALMHPLHLLIQPLTLPQPKAKKNITYEDYDSFHISEPCPICSNALGSVQVGQSHIIEIQIRYQKSHKEMWQIHLSERMDHMPHSISPGAQWSEWFPYIGKFLRSWYRSRILLIILNGPAQ